MKGQFAWQQFILLFTYACLMFQNCRFLLTGLISSWLPASLSKVGSAVYLTGKGRFFFGCRIWDVLNLPLSSCNVTLICCDLQIPHCMAQRQNECAYLANLARSRSVQWFQRKWISLGNEQNIAWGFLDCYWCEPVEKFDRVCFRGRFWTVPIPLRA